MKVRERFWLPSGDQKKEREKGEYAMTMAVRQEEDRFVEQELLATVIEAGGESNFDSALALMQEAKRSYEAGRLWRAGEFASAASSAAFSAYCGLADETRKGRVR